MKTRVGTFSLALLVVALALASTGCATSSSTKAKPLITTSGAPVHLGRYQVATITPFVVTASGVDASTGAKLADDIALRLEHDFGPLFREVRRASAPLGVEDEVVITGSVDRYKPGNKVGRALFGPLAAANFDGDVVVTDARDGRVLLSAPFEKMWGWGGGIGASKGIDDMRTEVAAAIASTIAHAKGWRPVESASAR